MSFQFVEISPEQKELMQEFRDKYEALYNELTQKIEASRGLSLAKTKLEESAFWLNKAISKNDN